MPARSRLEAWITQARCRCTRRSASHRSRSTSCAATRTILGTTLWCGSRSDPASMGSPVRCRSRRLDTDVPVGQIAATAPTGRRAVEHPPSRSSHWRRGLPSRSSVSQAISQHRVAGDEGVERRLVPWRRLAASRRLSDATSRRASTPTADTSSSPATKYRFEAAMCVRPCAWGVEVLT
jgi:hypothetical protein